MSRSVPGWLIGKGDGCEPIHQFAPGRTGTETATALDSNNKNTAKTATTLRGKQRGKNCCTNNNTVKAARVALIQLKILKKRAVHGNSAETAMPRPKLEQCCSSNCNSAAECKRKLQNQRRAWRRHPSSRPFTPALGRQK